MAPEDRPPPQHLTFLQKAAEKIGWWSLFAVVRGAEARAPIGTPLVGESLNPAEDIVELAQEPTLSFPGPTIARAEVVRGRARLSGYWLGLIGPMGPLPLHLSEYAVHEARGKARPFGRFLDLLSGRMLQLFYRAWADSQPAALLDRAEKDRFSDYIATLTGATEGVDAASAFPARARLQYASLFASRRSAVGIEDALTHLMRQPVTLLEFQPRWCEMEPEDLTRLGTAYATLGQDAMVGTRVRSASDAFRVVIRAASFGDYETLLPDGARFAVAAEALTAFSPSHLDWDIALEIDGAEARPSQLDGLSRLGWTSWVGETPAGTIRRDTSLRRRKLPIQQGDGI